MLEVTRGGPGSCLGGERWARVYDHPGDRLGDFGDGEPDEVPNIACSMSDRGVHRPGDRYSSPCSCYM